MIDFSIGYRFEETHRYGVDIRDLITMKEGLELIPVYELNPKDWESINYLLDYDLPIPEWKKIEKKMIVYPLENLKKQYPPPLFVKKDIFFSSTIIYKVNHKNKITNEVIKALKRILSEDPNIKGIDYSIYPISEDGKLYYIDIYLIQSSEAFPWTKKEILKAAKELKIDTSIISLETIIKGIETELEHGKINPRTNVTNSDLIVTIKIALAHLSEDPKYYELLSEMEKKSLDFWKEKEKPSIFLTSSNMF